MDAEMSKRVLDEFLKKTEDGFIVVDKEGIIREINENYCDFLARGRNEIIGRPINEVISTTSMLDVLKKRYAGDGNNVYVHPYKPGETRDDEEVYAAANRFCIFDDQDQLLGAAAHMKFRQRALDTSQKYRETELNYYKQEYQDQMQKEGGFANFRGNDPKIQHVKNLGMRIAKTDFPVLITGETGTGKEVIAKSIHMESSRSAEPFVAINCGAIPKELLESELFGYEEGAFTGAQKGGRPGKFELADTGTLFLDEIGDMPFDMQVKLLRVLQSGEIQRVGGLRTVPVDLRIISATNKDLKQAIAQHQFRADLYYRISTLSILVPPLRERAEDILPLAEHFIRRHELRLNRHPVPLPQETAEAIRRYPWPGNIRQLESAVERAVHLAEGGALLPEHFGIADLMENRRPAAPAPAQATLEDIERQAIAAALVRFGGNISQTAFALGVSRPTLYRKMDKYGLTD